MKAAFQEDNLSFLDSQIAKSSTFGPSSNYEVLSRVFIFLSQSLTVKVFLHVIPTISEFCAPYLDLHLRINATDLFPAESDGIIRG